MPGKNILKAQTIITASGKKINISLLKKAKGDLIISNNDFSVKYDMPPLITCRPPVKMGWLSRKKHRFFKEYNLLAEEFANLLKIDPWHLKIDTELFSPFEMQSKENLLKLKTKATQFLNSLKTKQPEFLKEKPYLFLKNNSGTYGLGVINILDPSQLDELSYKMRKKMKGKKGDTKN